MSTSAPVLIPKEQGSWSPLPLGSFTSDDGLQRYFEQHRRSPDFLNNNSNYNNKSLNNKVKSKLAISK